MTEEQELGEKAIQIGEKRIKFLMNKLMDEGLKAMSEMSNVTSDEIKVLTYCVENAGMEIERMKL